MLPTRAAYCLNPLSAVLTSICYPAGAWSCLLGMFSQPAAAHSEFGCSYLNDHSLFHGLLCREVTFTYAIRLFHLIS